VLFAVLDIKLVDHPYGLVIVVCVSLICK